MRLYNYIPNNLLVSDELCYYTMEFIDACDNRLYGLKYPENSQTTETVDISQTEMVILLNIPMPFGI